MEPSISSLQKKIKSLKAEINRLSVPIDTRYNGYRNYETWNVALWMSNDSSEYWDERAREVAEQADDRDDARDTLADSMKSEHEENTPEVTGMYADMMYADMMNAALSEVDWDEIAGHYIDDVWDEIQKEKVDAE